MITMSFVAGKFTCIYLWLLVVLLRLGWGQDLSNNSQIDGVNISTRGSQVISHTRIPRATSAVKRSCLAPRQPGNGEWRLQQDFCEESSVDCKVPEGIELGLGYQLIYSCTTGYKIVGNHIVFCRGGGTWSPIPTCEEIRCYPLNTVSRIAQCSHFRVSVDCDLPVPPKTRAEAFCRPGYEKDASLLTPRRNVLNCNDDGNWQPQPVRCSPVCGLEVTHQRPFVVNGSDADIVDFPWHATLYEERRLSEGTTKDFKCGATIIQANLLMTAAHCVYDERIRATVDPKKLFILTGNTLRDYDHPMHDFEIVRKGAVKRVYVNINYYGLVGNYASDIALLELQEPFVYSGILIPACLDTSGYSAPVLESGMSGKIAGFGRTATGDSSPVLQTITVPYIPYGECKASSNSTKNHIFITNDKFCAGYTDGRAVCEGDSGGGLVFRKNDRWYVMGIVSVGLGVDIDNGERQCDKYAYTLYTRVSDHAEWIVEIISDLEPSKSRPTWNFSLFDRQTPTSSVTSSSLADKSSSSPALTLQATTSSCLSPPQPTNGQWKLHPTQCNDKNCDLSQGVQLEPGSQLVYTCNPGYKLKGNTDVFCGRGGIWSSFPECIEMKCGPLLTLSRDASCYDPSYTPVDCESVSPGSTAIIICRSGYTTVSTLTPSLQSGVLTCNANGEWEPDPIPCLPVCGKAISHETPLVVNGRETILGDFPWHASVYMTNSPKVGSGKVFLCDATIIAANFLLTAAHCIYDKTTSTTIDPRKLFVITGNIFRGYDSVRHDAIAVRKTTVNSVHINCQYRGLNGNYSSDIALLQLENPFELSDILLPVCLDFSGYTGPLSDGAYGKISGFKTTATGSFSELQTITVPKISESECKAQNNSAGGYPFELNDKFCAGYNNGSDLCEIGGGGGLVFQHGDKWYLIGITSVPFSVDLDSGQKKCDRYSYPLYTRVSNYVRWIQDVMLQPERADSHPSCKGDA